MDIKQSFSKLKWEEWEDHIFLIHDKPSVSLHQSTKYFSDTEIMIQFPNHSFHILGQVLACLKEIWSSFLEDVLFGYCTEEIIEDSIKIFHYHVA